MHPKYQVILSLILMIPQQNVESSSFPFPDSNNPALPNSPPILFPDHFLWKGIVPSYFRELFENVHKQPDELPMILERLLEGVDTYDCKSHVVELIRTVLNATVLIGEDGKWAFQMIDAWGKPPEGLLTGHINLYGDFHECVGVRAEGLIGNELFPDTSVTSLKGRYCTAYLFDYNTSMSAVGRGVKGGEVQLHDTIGVKQAVSLEELVGLVLTQPQSMTMMMPTVGVCMPSTCSHLDVQNILVNMFNMTYSLAQQQVNPKMLPWPLTVSCFTDEKPPLDAAAISVIILLSTLLALALSSAILDYYVEHYKPDVRLPPALSYFMAFSLYTNTRKWLSTRKSADDLGCLHGMRFLSMAWVVLAHSYFVFIAQPQWNMVDIKNIWKDWTSLAVINGTFSVDTFFVMSGMLATYNIMKLLDKTKGKLNIFMFYVHRYVRLTPTYAILVGIAATLVSYTGSGPFWHNIDNSEKNCRDNWWINILYINNLYKSDRMCNGESWYLANDMQFYILSPLIVYPIWKWEVMGGLLLLIYTMLSLIAPVLVVRFAPAPPAMAITAKIIGKVNEIYFRPWSRIQVFLVGIWLGWLLHKTKNKRLHLSPLLVLAGWACSTAIALTILFSIHSWYDPTTPFPELGGYFYAGLSRFSWGLSISWIVFACVKGYGGLINKFLSWKVFMPLGRLSFCVYLTSIHLQDLFHARITAPLRFDSYTMVNFFFAHLVMSCIAGFICTMLFESPFMVLHKLVFEGNVSKKTSPKNNNNINPKLINGPYIINNNKNNNEKI